MKRPFMLLPIHSHPVPPTTHSARRRKQYLAYSGHDRSQLQIDYMRGPLECGSCLACTLSHLCGSKNVLSLMPAILCNHPDYTCGEGGRANQSIHSELCRLSGPTLLRCRPIRLLQPWRRHIYHRAWISVLAKTPQTNNHALPTFQVTRYHYGTAEFRCPTPVAYVQHIPA